MNLAVFSGVFHFLDYQKYCCNVMDVAISVDPDKILIFKVISLDFRTKTRFYYQSE
jgi:hypothetical protein